MNSSRARKLNILLIGSYNGQDSLGDECLLVAVVDRFRKRAESGAAFTLHTHTFDTNLGNLRQTLKIEQGLQSYYWRWNSLLHRVLRFRILAKFFANLFYPIFFLAWCFLSQKFRNCLKSILTADFIYFFGGTQCSAQWFWLNVPHIVVTMVIGKMSGAKVFFGPQQYGPQTAVQKQCMRLWTRLIANDYRCRSVTCLPLLTSKPELSQNRVVWDEVFSNTIRYPIRSERSKGEYILVNLRGGNFWDVETFEEAHREAMVRFLKKVHSRLGLPCVTFGVSNQSFSDDQKIMETCRLQGFTAVSPAGRVTDDLALVELATRAYGCLSMSFHGCLLSGMSGTPFIPITSGEYYDYKYDDFYKYGSSKLELRAISESDFDKPETLDYVCNYFEHFSPTKLADIRRTANARLDEYYDQILASLR